MVVRYFNIFYYICTDINSLIMAKITLYVRSSQNTGVINLRFRLRDGRTTQFFHPSNIEADVNDLKKLTNEGKPKPGVRIYNKDLVSKIEEESQLLLDAYNGILEDNLVPNIDLIEERIIAIKNPVKKVRQKELTLLERFNKYINEAVALNIIQESRHKRYKALYGSLERFLKIYGKIEYVATEFTPDDVLAFKSFITDEYLLVPKHKRIYAGLPSNVVPKQKRSQNTVVTMLKAFKAAYSGFGIDYNPFDKMPKKYRAALLREQYEEPICLMREEFFKVLNTEVSEALQETKDAFVLQCAFGARVGDFSNLSMTSVAVDDSGIPYIHYLPQKTERTNTRHIETVTPIIKYALEIIKRKHFDFHILNYVSGKDGYNVKIRRLLKFCGIDRPVKVLDEVSGNIVEVPLYEAGSSKLCRKTHVNIMNEIQIDRYAAGLHAAGSQAVERYISNTLTQHFILMCAAFNQPLYKVDKDLNVIE